MGDRLIDANLRFLEQARALLDGLAGEAYAREGPFGLASAGAHLRHVLDHYDCFLDGLATGEIDYDARSRDPSVERDPRRAADAVERIVAALRRAPVAPSRAVRVRMNCGEADGVRRPGASTVERELQFLVSHTVHHYALIKAALGAAGRELDASFGVAPSTLAYRSDASCAR